VTVPINQEVHMSVLKKTMRLEAMRRLPARSPAWLDEDDEYCVATFVGFHDEESGDAYDDSTTEVTFTVEEARALGEHMFETFELTVAPLVRQRVGEVVVRQKAPASAARRPGAAAPPHVKDVSEAGDKEAEALTDCAIDYLRNLSPSGKWDEKLVKAFMERPGAAAILAEHVAETKIKLDVRKAVIALGARGSEAVEEELDDKEVSQVEGWLR